MAHAYVNPIMPGFAPDPTICHVDGTYYLSNSSFHMFPGLPIYTSKNLKSWTQIGNAINRPEQLSLEHAICMKASDDTGRLCIGSMGLLAPTIRYHKGIFYMICTNLSRTAAGFKPMNFYVTSSDIRSNIWSDPIYYEWNGIDPSMFFDDDDRVYIQGQAVIGDRSKQPTGHIKQCELDIKTGKLIGEPKVIWGGWNGIDTEGPHIYKRNGWYYCLAAEGGTFESHVLSIGRSRSIWGPFEQCPSNPVLTAKGTTEYVQNTGHGDMFEDSQGLWWAAVLAIRDGPGRRYPLSRETFLTPVTWAEDNWPVFVQPKIDMERAESEVLVNTDKEDTPDAEAEYLYIRNPDLDLYKIGHGHKEVTLTSSETKLTASTGTTTFIGKRQRGLSSTASMTITINPTLKGKDLEVGLAVYKDEYRFAHISYSYRNNEIVFSYQQQEPTLLVHAGRYPNVSQETIDFKIDSSETKYTFSYKSGSTEEWATLGELDTIEMTARDFTGPIYGIYASGEQGLQQAFSNIAL